MFLTPFMVLLAAYLYIDPFKVVWHYDNYYAYNGGGALNRNYVSTMTYLNQYERYHYDSFIFGNSRSLFYRVADWKKHLPASAFCYHFSESGGSINGIYYKVRLIDQLGEHLRHVLIVADYTLLRSMQQQGAVFSMPPALDKSNFFAFHCEHLKNWFNPSFLYYFTKYHVTGTYTPDMGSYILTGKNYRYYDPVTNEEPNGVQDSLIAIGKYYDEKTVRAFAGKHRPDTLPVILDKEEAIGRLCDMQRIFQRHHTVCRIVISPLYDQVSLHPKDVATLKRIFGEKSVYDFSGVNRWTEDEHNYYEPSHYLPSVAAEIMDSLF